MYIQQLYTGCLSEAAYYIESNGEAAIVDPLRDIDAYLQLAAERKATIKYIFETHFHADFVSGHIDLAKATGATIVYGPDTETRLPVHIARHGEAFRIGALTVTVLHTPGHTLESSCYLLTDEQGKEHCLFTGDTLFVGDVGRPDLAQKGADLTMEDLAGMLYDSLHKHILTRPDDVIVYPAHGPGSACGKSLGPETFSSIGQQKATNYALQPQTKAEFVQAVTDGLTAPPQYFPINARINKEGYEELDSVLAKGLTPLSVADVKAALERDALLLDTRHASVFTEGFVPGSVFVGLEGRFAEWAGSLLPYTGEMILLTEPGKERETLVRLARVGFQNVIGYLEGGFEAWQKAGEAIDLIIDVDVDELAMDLPFDENLLVVDVRKPAEFAEGHVKDAQNLPLNDMTDPALLAQFEDEQNLYVHCQGGYRSVIAISLMKRQGIHNVRNVLGGWNAIKKEEKIRTEKESSVLN
ncbi:MBL fold metallo-hydrolase [Flaviaesturariibacter aridisoli]|uniref:MBL fold metallo-hydrolase n=1 Tax=Flaviaesturariibacter aridisoli TaxID=2545761 RepID=A0A4R4E5Z6_9BACT|nr:MBL fold metallo-hydrolase [Flaviaesturariibacter aridisoli]TCZ73098.1 MBL fold metallo-hydrolase [Flaviaesturariibacter aridisoli]